MIRNLKRKLYFLFASSIMFVFTIVFFLLASENIETMQNAELNFVNRQATNLTLLFEDSTNYVENLEICEKNMIIFSAYLQSMMNFSMKALI